MNGRWLLEQLPQSMAQDDFLSRYVNIFEDIGASVRDRVDEVDMYFDLGLGPPEVVRWMASWVGYLVDPALPVDRQRALARAIGPTFGRRGTRRGIKELLAAVTQADVTVEDSGGVYEEGGAPWAAKRVTIRVATSGDLDEQQLLRLVTREVPADTTVELVVGTSAITVAEPEVDLDTLLVEAMTRELRAMSVDSTGQVQGSE